MQKLIISDTSCLILLENIGELAVLKKLYHQIYITSIIANEFGSPLPSWINIIDPQNTNYLDVLSTTIDLGEASAIALALEEKNTLLIIDDYKARLLAKQLKLKFTGTLGVLLEAKAQGYILSLKQILEKIRSTNFRISPDLEKKVLEKAGEL